MGASCATRMCNAIFGSQQAAEGIHEINVSRPGARTVVTWFLPRINGCSFFMPEGLGCYVDPPLQRCDYCIQWEGEIKKIHGRVLECRFW